MQRLERIAAQTSGSVRAAVLQALGRGVYSNSYDDLLLLTRSVRASLQAQGTRSAVNLLCVGQLYLRALQITLNYV